MVTPVAAQLLNHTVKNIIVDFASDNKILNEKYEAVVLHNVELLKRVEIAEENIALLKNENKDLHRKYELLMTKFEHKLIFVIGRPHLQ